MSGVGCRMGESSARFFPVRVPAVYLTSAYSLFLAFFTFNRINNLRVFNVAFSSIPTAPTNSYYKAVFFSPFAPT
jgi:hypothetical protein